MSSVEVAGTFVREHLRARMSLVLLVAIPALFVLTAASVLGQFSRALGGSVAGNAGPGMSDGGLLSSVTPTSKAANLLTAAGAGAASPGSDWVWSGAIVSGALIVAAGIFWLSARART